MMIDHSILGLWSDEEAFIKGIHWMRDLSLEDPLTVRLPPKLNSRSSIRLVSYTPVAATQYLLIQIWTARQAGEQAIMFLS